MQQFGGKDSKRHFTVVMGGKEHGLMFLQHHLLQQKKQ